MVRRRFRPLIAFAAVIAAAGSVTAAGLTFTAHTVSKTVAELPEVKTRVLPSYVVRLPEATAADLDISKAVEVKPKVTVPATVPQIPVAQAAVTTADEVAPPTLVAEVSPLDDGPAADGDLYVVKSDVFVRSGPSKRYGEIGTATGGMQLTVTGEEGGWLKVGYKGGSGWVYQSFLAPVRGEAVAEADTGRAPF
jgi:hypothetical protein